VKHGTRGFHATNVVRALTRALPFTRPSAPPRFFGRGFKVSRPAAAPCSTLPPSTRAMQRSRKTCVFFLVEGYALIYRAFFAMIFGGPSRPDR